MALVGVRALTEEDVAARGLELDQQLQVLLDRARRWGFVVSVKGMAGSVRPAPKKA